MGAATTELKVVLAVVQESSGALKTIIADLAAILGAVKNLNTVSLSSVAQQIKEISEAAGVGIGPALSNGVKAAGTDLKEAGKKAEEAGHQVHEAGEQGKNLHHIKEHADESSAAINRLEHFVAGFFSRLREGTEFLLGLELVKFIRDIADVAAKTQVLGTTLNLVAQNAGISSVKINEYDARVQKLGITASASRRSLTLMVTAGLDPEKATGLARMSQDAASLSGGLLNSSQAFETMVRAIQLGDSESLRGIGINTDFDASYRKLATALHTVPDALSPTEKATARLNAVMTFGPRIAGAYEAAMNDVGKQITSLPRYVEELKDSLGQSLLPAYLAIVVQTTQLLKNLKLVSEEESKSGEGAKALGEALNGLLKFIREVIELVVQHRYILIKLLELYGIWKLAVLGIQGLTLLGQGTTNFLVWVVKAISWVGGLSAAHVVQAKAARDAAVAEGELAVAEGAAGAAAVGEAGAQTAALAAKATVFGRFVSVFKSIPVLLGGVGAAIAEVGVATIAGMAALALAAVGVGAIISDFAHKYLIKEDPKPEDKGKPPNPRDNPAALAAAKTAKDLVEETQRLETARKKLLGEQDAFVADITNFQTILRGFSTPIKGAEVSVTDLTNGLKKISEAAKTKEDLKLVTQAVAEYKKVLSDKGLKSSFGDEALAVAAQKVIDTERSFGAELVTLRAAHAATQDEKQKIELEDQLARVKQSNTLREDEDKHSYEIGAIDLQQYYDRRRDRINREAKAEEELQKHNIEALIHEANVKQASNSKDQNQELENKITAAKNTLLRIPADTANKLASNDNEQSEKKIALEKQLREYIDQAAASTEGEEAKVKQLRDRYEELVRTAKQLGVPLGDLTKAFNSNVEAVRKGNEEQRKAINDATLQYYGSFDEKLAAINDKFEKLARSPYFINSVAGKAILEDAKAMEVFKAKIEAANRVLKEQIDLQSSVVTLRQAQLKALAGNGTLSDSQQQNLSNDLIRTEQVIVREQIANKERLIRLTQDQIDKNIKANLPTSALSDQLNTLNAEANGLQAHFIDLGTSINSYGKQLRESFTTNLASALQQTIEHTKNAGQAFQELGQSIQHQITSIFTKNLATDLTKFLTSSLGGGQNGIFGTIGKLLGDKDSKADGSSANKALYVKMAGFEGVGAGKGLSDIIGSKDGSDTYEKAKQSGFGGTAIGTTANQLERDASSVLSSVKDGFNKFFSGLTSLFSGSGGAGGNGAAFGSLLSGLSGLFHGSPASVNDVLASGSGSTVALAGGGFVSGPGTGTSDSIPAMLSHGEFVTPAEKTRRFLPLLEAIRNGTLSGYAMGGLVQSIALGVSPLRMAEGGLVDGAAAIHTGGGLGTLQLQLHPDAMHMSMQDWLNKELVRQFGRR